MIKVKFISIINLIIVVSLFAQKEALKTTSVFGFFQPLYQMNLSNSSIPNNEFKLNRIRVGIENRFSNWLKGEIELDPLEQVIIKDAIIELKVLDELEISFGRQKIPFSFERLTSVKSIPFFERSKIVKELDQLGYCGRDVGVQVSYIKNFDNIKFNLIAGVFNGNSGIPSGDNNNSKSFGERLEISSGKSIRIGINSSQKIDSISAKYFVANGFDFSVKVLKNITLTSEFLYGKKNSQTTIGGYYTLLEYNLDDFTFGIRFNQYFKDVKKTASNFYEAKIDWKPEKFLRFQINFVSEEKNSKFDNNLLLGVSYEI